MTRKLIITVTGKDNEGSVSISYKYDPPIALEDADDLPPSGWATAGYDY